MILADVVLSEETEPTNEVNLSQAPPVFDGLPGEVEYDVDLTDQKKLRHDQSEESEEETEVGLFDWLSRLKMGEDLADSVDQFICAWDKVVGTEIDTLVVLLLGNNHSQ